MSNSHRVSVTEKIGYGLGDSASNVVFQMVMMLMAFFYTDIFGITAAAMGTLFLVVRIFDAVTDPVMGAIADRTNTRWGKFRPFLLWLCVPYAVIAVLAFTTPDFSASGKLIWAYATYSLLMAAYTAINIPYCALGGVITADTRERVSLNSYRFFLATGAGVLVAMFTLKLVEVFGQGNQQKGFQLAMAAFAGLAVVLFVVCFATTRERVREAASTTSSLRKDLQVLFTNDQWLLVAVLNLILLMALVIRGSAAIYYMNNYAAADNVVARFLGSSEMIVYLLGSENLVVSAFLTVGMLSAMFGAAFASPLTKRLTKIQAYVLIQSTVAAASIGLFFVGNEDVLAIFGLFAVVQFFVQMGAPILWAMMADTVDYGELHSGRRITGLIFSGSLFSLKIGMALGGALFGWLLAYFGYQGGAEAQSPEAIRGIVLLFTVIPAVGHVLMAVIVTRYKLDSKTCDEIRAQLDSRQRAGENGSAPVVEGSHP